MKKILLASLAIVSVLLSSCSKKLEKGEFTVEKGKFSVGSEIGYPPFEYYDEDGTTPIGLDMDLAREVAKRLGLECTIIDTAWDGIFDGLKIDRYDAVMSAATITPERLENYDFTQSYIGNGQALIVRKDSTLDISSLEDVAGLQVGYQAETTSDFYIKKHAAELGFEYVACEYDKVLNAYDDLKFGRIDVVISDSLVAVSYLTAENSEFKQVWAGEPDEYFGICVKKGNTVLLEKLNAVLTDMKNDGSLSELYMKVFGMDLSDSINE